MFITIRRCLNWYNNEFNDVMVVGLKKVKLLFEPLTFPSAIVYLKLKESGTVLEKKREHVFSRSICIQFDCPSYMTFIL